MEKVMAMIKVFDLDVINIEDVVDSYSSEVKRLTLKGGDKVILKIPYSKDKLIREWLTLKNTRGILPVPRVLDYFLGDEKTPGAMLLSYIEGNPIRGSINEDLAYQMGVLLAKVHDVKMPGYGYYDIEDFVFEGNNRWWEAMRERFMAWYEICRGYLDSPLLDKSMAYFETFYSDLPQVDGPALVHMDFRPGNILVKNNRIQGLIDFESARGGSADIDFTKIKQYVWERYTGTREAFITGYESVRDLPPIDRTLTFYHFFNSFGGVAWCIKREKVKSDFLKENSDVLKKILMT